MNILLIEPDRVLARTYHQALSSSHTVRTASSPAAALQLLEAELPDLLILELQTGSHNGVELLYELRSYSDWQTIPVIIHSFVSPRSLELSGDILKGLGVLDFLYKPTTDLRQ